jgi:hypothetical protein
MTKGDNYRRRSDNIAKMIKKVGKSDKEKLKKKKTAIDAMADTEDWLEGKPGSSLEAK